MTTELFQWLSTYQAEIAAVGSFSAMLLLVTVLATPWMASLLPVDYFRRHSKREMMSGWMSVSWSLLRNIAGAILLVLGFLMLVLPGPGIVSIILGLSLCEFPGKQVLLRKWVKRHPGILTSLNWLRDKYGKEHLLPPED